MFGKNCNLPVGQFANQTIIAQAETEGFTQRWKHFEIEMNGDWICDGNSSFAYRSAGYPLGHETKNADPKYASIEIDPNL